MWQVVFLLVAFMAAGFLLVTLITPVLRLFTGVQLLSYLCGIYLIWFGWYVYAQYTEPDVSSQNTEAVLVIGTASFFN